MILRSLHIYLYIYYFYCYAFYCSKQSVFILESGNFNCSNNTTAHNEEIHINHDICSINAGGLIKKILYPMVNYFNGKVEYIQVIGLLIMVKLQITLTGQYMSPKTLTYDLCNGILSNWYCTSQVLSCLYNYYLLFYYYNVYIWLVYKPLFNYYCYCHAFYWTKDSVAVQKSDRCNYIKCNEEKHKNPDITFINLFNKMFSPFVNKFICKLERLQEIGLLTLVKIQSILPGQCMSPINLIYFSNENIT